MMFVWCFFLVPVFLFVVFSLLFLFDYYPCHYHQHYHINNSSVFGDSNKNHHHDKHHHSHSHHHVPWLLLA